jgi:trk system potassium uptake protein
VKILIAGAGEVGFELAKLLSGEKHDVTVLDSRDHCLQRVMESLDVLVVLGNATSPNALVEAGAREADLMVSVTNSDEVNIIASMMGKRLGVKSVIARVRNDELTRSNSPITPSELGIDLMIHPEEVAAAEIHQLVKRAAAIDIVYLADDKLVLVGFRVEKNSEVAGKTLSELAVIHDDLEFRIVAISRRGTTIIPGGNNRLMGMDYAFILTTNTHLNKIAIITGHNDKPLRRIMIAGGNQVGRILAAKLSADSQKWEIKLIEPDKSIATRIANENRGILVLHGNPTDPNLLVTEGVQEMDAFISVTDDEESNIISCLMAKHLEVKKTVALVSKTQYVPLSQTIGIDAIVNVKGSASDEIHRQIRQGLMLKVKALKGIKAEIIEVVAAGHCKLLQKPLKKLNLPKGVVIGGILHNGSTEIATGESVIYKNDRVIVFALPRDIQKVEQLFG